MGRTKFKRIGGHLLNAIEDAPDFRDYVYEPALVRLKKTLTPPRSLAILDQGNEGACTGFGLAAVINLLNSRRQSRYRVSERMLYEMARKFDDWPGEDYEGSSCRGAIRGWYSMGVCRQSEWKFDLDDPGKLTVKRAKDARNNTLGAYYRVNHEITHFHAALNEVGALYVSAEVHDGWQEGRIKDGRIPFRKRMIGGHAFAIVGYNSDGFWIQNSWGPEWGKRGLALWNYEDWQANIYDAWVFRMGLPSPKIWHLPPNERSSRLDDPEQLGRTPNRAEIAGHFVHLDDGKLVDKGRYWSNLTDVAQTAKFVAASDRYDHLLLYAHGGLNSPKASATRIAAMKEVFKDNGIYPYHIMYDTGLMEELKDAVMRRHGEAKGRAAGFTDWIDRLIERGTRPAGRSLWREMKAGASIPFTTGGDGTQLIETFLDAFMATEKSIEIHVAGHSTGGVMLAYLLDAMAAVAPAKRVSSCHLMAPAATVDLFKSHYFPHLVARKPHFGVDKMTVYNLSERLEQRDNVAKAYRKSLLYLVSRAFEEETPEALLGMQIYSEALESTSTLR